MKHFVVIIVFFAVYINNTCAQVTASKNKILAATPPMGWMSWNFFGDNINEQSIKEMCKA